MSEKVIQIGNEQITLRRAQSLEEVLQVQELDTLTWPEGYKHYKDLFDLDPYSIFVAVNQAGKVVSHVGVERINQSDLGIGMPPWDHDPRANWHKPNGDTWYITGHVVDNAYRKCGLSHEMISYLKEIASDYYTRFIAVIHRLNHPTLGKVSEFWKHHGFVRLDQTLDPNWKAAPTAEGSGGVIYSLRIN